MPWKDRTVELNLVVDQWKTFDHVSKFVENFSMTMIRWELKIESGKKQISHDENSQTTFQRIT